MLPVEPLQNLHILMRKILKSCFSAFLSSGTLLRGPGQAVCPASGFLRRKRLLGVDGMTSGAYWRWVSNKQDVWLLFWKVRQLPSLTIPSVMMYAMVWRKEELSMYWYSAPDHCWICREKDSVQESVELHWVQQAMSWAGWWTVVWKKGEWNWWCWDCIAEGKVEYLETKAVVRVRDLQDSGMFTMKF